MTSVRRLGMERQLNMYKHEMVNRIIQELEIRGWVENRDFYKATVEDMLSIALEYGMQPPAIRVVEEDFMGDPVIRVRYGWDGEDV